MNRSQKIYCPSCGVKFLSNFRRKLCCSDECVQELDWRRTLFTTGEKYRPDPERKNEKIIDKMLRNGKIIDRMLRNGKIQKVG